MKKYIIIDKINNNINYYNNEMEQGFSLDIITNDIEYKYPFLNIKINYYNNGDIIVIREK